MRAVLMILVLASLGACSDFANNTNDPPVLPQTGRDTDSGSSK